MPAFIEPDTISSFMEYATFATSNWSKPCTRNKGEIPIVEGFLSLNIRMSVVVKEIEVENNK
jgi:hypothetical protein